MSNDIEERFTAARQFVEARFASYPPEACAVLIAAYVTATGGKVAGKDKKKEAKPAELEADQVARFILESCERGKPDSKTRVIHDRYLTWAKGNGIAAPVTIAKFSRIVQRQGILTRRAGGSNWFCELHIGGAP